MKVRSTYNEWDNAVRVRPGANNGLAAGNHFNNFAGDGAIELVGSYGGGGGGSTLTGWRVAYNSFQNCGGYSYVVVGGQDNTGDHNTSSECGEGVENDDTSEATGGNVFDHETVINNLGCGYCQTVVPGPTQLTGGSAAGANYSGNTVSNSNLSGPASCIYEAATGGSQNDAQYINDTCTNGCPIIGP